MTKLKILLLSAIALFCQTAYLMAQKAPKEIVVVMTKNYTYGRPPLVTACDFGKR